MTSEPAPLTQYPTNIGPHKGRLTIVVCNIHSTWRSLAADADGFTESQFVKADYLLLEVYLDSNSFWRNSICFKEGFF